MLRTSGPKLVVVTLHKRGCIWILPADPPQYDHIDGDPPQVDQWYTNMAGDVFRAIFTAALLEIREKQMPIGEVKTIESICGIANKIAAEKVKYPTVKDMISSTGRELFQEWRDQLP